MEPTVLADYHNAVQFAAERFSPVTVAETERMKVVLTCFEVGQFIPVHAPRVDMALIVLEGDAVVVAGPKEEHRVGPGAIVVVPAGQSRGVRAITRLVAVHVVSPPPGESDHADVQAGLRQGTWR
jgi:quercetin dioxygenase-like cupin family protein